MSSTKWMRPPHSQVCHSVRLNPNSDRTSDRPTADYRPQYSKRKKLKQSSKLHKFFSRSIKIPIQEHKRCLKTGLLSHSAYAEHQHETGHTILSQNSQVLSKAPHFYDPKNREANEIHKCPHNLNPSQPR